MDRRRRQGSVTALRHQLRRQLHLPDFFNGLWYASARSWADADKRPLLKELLKRLTSRAAGKRFAEEARLRVDLDARHTRPARGAPRTVVGAYLARGGDARFGSYRAFIGQLLAEATKE
jgi:hypothetical protein